MNLTGRCEIPAPRQKVWEALNEPEILRQAIPGCTSLEKLSDLSFAAKVTSKVGPITASFGGEVTLSELDPPNSYVISGKGQGGAAGFAKGTARIRLSEEAGGTVLDYNADVDIGGKLATLGSRLIQGVAKKNADDFFAAFIAAIPQVGTAEPEPPALTEPTAPSGTIEPKISPGSSNGWIYALLGGLAVFAILFYLTR